MDYIISQNQITVPVIALRGLVSMPGVTIQFDVGRKKSVMAVDSAMKNDQLVFLTAQRTPLPTILPLRICLRWVPFPASNR